MFLSSIYCDIWLCRSTTIDLFVSFLMGYSYGLEPFILVINMNIISPLIFLILQFLCSDLMFCYSESINFLFSKKKKCILLENLIKQ